MKPQSRCFYTLCHLRKASNLGFIFTIPNCAFNCAGQFTAKLIATSKLPPTSRRLNREWQSHIGQA
jgi:hypothetical protein